MTTKSTVKITLWGGFHNSHPVNAIISADAYEDLSRGLSPLHEVLSNSQYKKIDRYFCGIKGCRCAGAMSAKWAIADKK